jgi:hypothetical protein
MAKCPTCNNSRLTSSEQSSGIWYHCHDCGLNISVEAHDQFWAQPDAKPTFQTYTVWLSAFTYKSAVYHLSICDYCKNECQCLSVDTSDGEYEVASLCQACIIEGFEAHARRAKGQGDEA